MLHPQEDFPIDFFHSVLQTPRLFAERRGVASGVKEDPEKALLRPGHSLPA